MRPDLREVYKKKAHEGYAANRDKKSKCPASRRFSLDEMNKDKKDMVQWMDSVPFTLSEPVEPGSLLGSGTYGQVYLCNWLGSKLALKVPHRSSDEAKMDNPPASDSPVSEAFRTADLAREGALMKQLSGHPNIAHAYQLVSLPGGAVGMLMEVAEVNLLQHCLMLKNSEEPWSDMKFQVWKLFRQVLAGLAHIQAKKILHCDLKTNNILVFAGHRRAAIADFGLSRRVNALGQVIVYGHAVYAKGYRPVECQVAGDKKVASLVASKPSDTAVSFTTIYIYSGKLVLDSVFCFWLSASCKFRPDKQQSQYCPCSQHFPCNNYILSLAAVHCAQSH